MFPAINKHTTDLPKMFIVKTFSTCQQINLFKVVPAPDLEAALYSMMIAQNIYK